MKIKLGELKEGVNRFRFTIPCSQVGLPEEFFKGNLQADIRIDKGGDQLLVRISAETKGSFTCDRCLELFNRSIEGKIDIVFFPSPRDFDSPPNGEVRWSKPQTSEIDLGGDVREALMLALPSKHLCKEDCRGLCPQCGANLNRESCACRERPVDPRWKGLEELLQKD